MCLVLCLSLTGCAAAPQLSQTPNAAPLLGGAAGLDEEEILLRVDGREIPAWRYLYWLARACDTICGEYRAAGMEPDWTAAPEGRSLAEYAKSRALSDTALYAVVENLAERCGCAGEEEAALLRPVPELGLNEARAAELDRVGQMYQELYALFCTEGSAISPSEEELSAFAAENGWIGYEQIVVAFGEDRAAAKAQAAELFSRLNAAEDAAAEFSALAAAGGGAVGLQTLGPDDGGAAAARDALEHLSVGQYSGILETEDGFAVFLRCQPRREDLLEPCFDALLRDAAESAEVQAAAAYTALDVPSFYRSLEQLREDIFSVGNGAEEGAA